jgi:hypothetical protein
MKLEIDTTKKEIRIIDAVNFSELNVFIQQALQDFNDWKLVPNYAYPYMWGTTLTTGYNQVVDK